MNAIFKVNNVYVTVKNNEVRDGIEVTNLDELIISTEEKTSASLYGGRVWVEKVSRNYRTCYTLMIDGIEIYDIDVKFSYFNEYDAYDIEKIAAYLNQIENLGIETFLDNYRKQLETLRDKLEGIASDMQQNAGDEEDNEKLNDIRRSIIRITSFLFALYVNMNAGIEMQDYIDAYNTIINMYF
jgi:hypothetical protein